MRLLRFLLHLLIFIGALAAAAALVLSILLMLRFPPLLVAVVLACWMLNRLLRLLCPRPGNPCCPPPSDNRQPVITSGHAFGRYYHEEEP
ncbi:hypothetical protein [Pseudomonas aeruginosa]|uniref:hypothetical protein n=2 Tax=Pseudomonas aeruginosa TaxID=287 RepID=UPI000D3D4E54|nr:hypothetical protein [Pseudomonas aeruginosa]PTV68505.1 hypothetical protein DBL08_13015 [Pseudomonas aeruginosa]PTV80794.1 hypothetical protein DBL10_16210 [Pseudomonas aeruginosa]PTV87667.1 hypothetical protein DBL09_12460 [Pseudomonas aeruginosa]